MPCQLHGISPLISPELLFVISKMGHGDEIVFADANFPSHSTAKRAGSELISADGISSVAALIEAVCKLFPLDTFVAAPVAMMAPVPGDTTDVEPIVAEYATAVGTTSDKVELVERFAFYARAERAYAVVKTAEPRKYANVILKKGIII